MGDWLEGISQWFGLNPATGNKPVDTAVQISGSQGFDGPTCSLARDIKDGNAAIVSLGYHVKYEVKDTAVPEGSGNYKSKERIGFPLLVVQLPDNKVAKFSTHDNLFYQGVEEVHGYLRRSLTYNEGRKDWQLVTKQEAKKFDKELKKMFRPLQKKGKQLSPKDLQRLFVLYRWARTAKTVRSFSKRLKSIGEILTQVGKNKANLDPQLFVAYRQAQALEGRLRAVSNKAGRKERIQLFVKHFADPKNKQDAQALLAQVKSHFGAAWFQAQVVKKYGLKALGNVAVEFDLAVQLVGLLHRPNVMRDGVIEYATHLFADYKEEKLGIPKLPPNTADVKGLIKFYQELKAAVVAMSSKVGPADFDPIKPENFTGMHWDAVGFYRRAVLKKRYKGDEDGQKTLARFDQSYALVRSGRGNIWITSRAQFGQIRVVRKVKNTRVNVDGTIQDFEGFVFGSQDDCLPAFTNDFLRLASQNSSITFPMKKFGKRMTTEPTNLLAEVITRRGGALTADLYRSIVKPAAALQTGNVPTIILPRTQIEDRRFNVVLEKEVLPLLSRRGIKMTAQQAHDLLAPYRTGKKTLSFIYVYDEDSGKITWVRSFDIPDKAKTPIADLARVNTKVTDNRLAALLRALLQYGQFGSNKRIAQKRLRDVQDLTNELIGFRTKVGQDGQSANMMDISLLLARAIVKSRLLKGQAVPQRVLDAAVRRTQKMISRVAMASKDKTVKGTLAALKNEVIKRLKYEEAVQAKKRKGKLEEAEEEAAEYEDQLEGYKQQQADYDSGALSASDRIDYERRQDELQDEEADNEEQLDEIERAEADRAFDSKVQVKVRKLSALMLAVLQKELDLRTRLGNGEIDKYEMTSVASQSMGNLAALYPKVAGKHAHLYTKVKVSDKTKVRFLVMDAPAVNKLVSNAAGRSYLQGGVVVTENHQTRAFRGNAYAVPKFAASIDAHKLELNDFRDKHELVEKQPVLAMISFLVERAGGVIPRTAQGAIDLTHFRPEHIRALALWNRDRIGYDSKKKNVGRETYERLERVAQYAEKGIVITEQLALLSIYYYKPGQIKAALKSTYPKITDKQMADMLEVIKTLRFLFDFISRTTGQVENSTQQKQLEQDMGIVPDSGGRVTILGDRVRDMRESVGHIPMAPTKSYVDMIDKYTVLAIKEMLFPEEVATLQSKGTLITGDKKQPFWKDRTQYFRGKGMYVVGGDYIRGFVSKYPALLRMNWVDLMTGMHEEILNDPEAQKNLEHPAAFLKKFAARLEREQRDETGKGQLDSLHYDPNDDKDTKVAKMILQAAMMRRRVGVKGADDLLDSTWQALNVQFDQLVRGRYNTYPYAVMLKGFLMEQKLLQWKPGISLNDKQVSLAMVKSSAIVFRRFLTQNKDVSPKRQEEYLTAWRKQGFKFTKFSDLEQYCQALETYLKANPKKKLSFQFDNKTYPDNVPKPVINAMKVFVKAVMPYNEGMEAGMTEQFNMGAILRKHLGRKSYALAHQKEATLVPKRTYVDVMTENKGRFETGLHVFGKGVVKSAHFTAGIPLVIALQMGAGAIYQLATIDSTDPTAAHDREEVGWMWVASRLMFLAFHLNPWALLDQLEHSWENKDYAAAAFEGRFLSHAVNGLYGLVSKVLVKAIKQVPGTVKGDAIADFKRQPSFEGLADRQIEVMQREISEARRFLRRAIVGTASHLLDAPGAAKDTFLHPIDYTREVTRESFARAWRLLTGARGSNQRAVNMNLGFDVRFRGVNTDAGMTRAQRLLAEAIANPAQSFSLDSNSTTFRRATGIFLEHFDGLARRLIALAMPQNFNRQIPNALNPNDFGFVARNLLKASHWLRRPSRQLTHDTVTTTGYDIWALATGDGSRLTRARGLFRRLHDPAFRAMVAELRQAAQGLEVTPDQQRLLNRHMVRARRTIRMRQDNFIDNLRAARRDLRSQIRLGVDPNSNRYQLRMRGIDFLHLIKYHNQHLQMRMVEPLGYIPLGNETIGRTRFGQMLSIHGRLQAGVMRRVMNANPLSGMINNGEFIEFWTEFNTAERQAEQPNEQVRQEMARQAFLQQKIGEQITQPAAEFGKVGWFSTVIVQGGSPRSVIARQTRFLRTKALLSWMIGGELSALPGEPTPPQVLEAQAEAREILGRIGAEENPLTPREAGRRLAPLLQQLGQHGLVEILQSNLLPEAETRQAVFEGLNEAITEENTRAQESARQPGAPTPEEAQRGRVRMILQRIGAAENGITIEQAGRLIAQEGRLTFNFNDFLRGEGVADPLQRAAIEGAFERAGGVDSPVEESAPEEARRPSEAERPAEAERASEEAPRGRRIRCPRNGHMITLPEAAVSRFDGPRVTGQWETDSRGRVYYRITRPNTGADVLTNPRETLRIFQLRAGVNASSLEPLPEADAARLPETRGIIEPTRTNPLAQQSAHFTPPDGPRINIPREAFPPGDPPGFEPAFRLRGGTTFVDIRNTAADGSVQTYSTYELRNGQLVETYRNERLQERFMSRFRRIFGEPVMPEAPRTPESPRTPTAPEGPRTPEAAVQEGPQRPAEEAPKAPAEPSEPAKPAAEEGPRRPAVELEGPPEPPKPEPKAEPKEAPKPEPKAEPKEAPKPEPKAQPKEAPKAEVKAPVEAAPKQNPLEQLRGLEPGQVNDLALRRAVQHLAGKSGAGTYPQLNGLLKEAGLHPDVQKALEQGWRKAIMGESAAPKPKVPTGETAPTSGTPADGKGTTTPEAPAPKGDGKPPTKAQAVNTNAGTQGHQIGNVEVFADGNTLRKVAVNPAQVQGNGVVANDNGPQTEVQVQDPAQAQTDVKTVNDNAKLTKAQKAQARRFVQAAHGVAEALGGLKGVDIDSPEKVQKLMNEGLEALGKGITPTMLFERLASPEGARFLGSKRGQAFMEWFAKQGGGSKSGTVEASRGFVVGLATVLGVEGMIDLFPAIAKRPAVRFAVVLGAAHQANAMADPLVKKMLSGAGRADMANHLRALHDLARGKNSLYKGFFSARHGTQGAARAIGRGLWKTWGPAGVMHLMKGLGEMYVVSKLYDKFFSTLGFSQTSVVRGHTANFLASFAIPFVVRSIFTRVFAGATSRGATAVVGGAGLLTSALAGGGLALMCIDSYYSFVKDPYENSLNSRFAQDLGKTNLLTTAGLIEGKVVADHAHGAKYVSLAADYYYDNGVSRGHRNWGKVVIARYSHELHQDIYQSQKLKIALKAHLRSFAKPGESQRDFENRLMKMLAHKIEFNGAQKETYDFVRKALSGEKVVELKREEYVEEKLMGGESWSYKRVRFVKTGKMIKIKGLNDPALIAQIKMRTKLAGSGQAGDPVAVYLDQVNRKMLQDQFGYLHHVNPGKLPHKVKNAVVDRKIEGLKGNKREWTKARRWHLARINFINDDVRAMFTEDGVLTSPSAKVLVKWAFEGKNGFKQHQRKARVIQLVAQYHFVSGLVTNAFAEAKGHQVKVAAADQAFYNKVKTAYQAAVASSKGQGIDLMALTGRIFRANFTEVGDGEFLHMDGNLNLKHPLCQQIVQMAKKNYRATRKAAIEEMPSKQKRLIRARARIQYWVALSTGDSKGIVDNQELLEDLEDSFTWMESQPYMAKLTKIGQGIQTGNLSGQALETYMFSAVMSLIAPSKKA